MTLPPALHPPAPHITIRQTSPADLNRLLLDCWTDRRRDVGRWLLDRAERNRQNQRGESLVVITGQQHIVSYGQLTLWPRCGEISDLVTAPAHRSRGYGTALIQALTAEAITMGARCVEIGAAKSNPRAVALYHRLGFIEHRVIEMPLNNGAREPVVYMILDLPA
jgi:ribosomal protein S18 acetylase RimI-like enzyme